MKNLANFMLFQAGWFACVWSAANGLFWMGPLVAVLLLGLHLTFLSSRETRVYELGYIIAVTLMGLLLDTLLTKLGATRYPSSEAAWDFVIVPPWIIALWALFGSLPHHSLGWLVARPVIAAVLGAIGGPLSYLAGVRMGAVGVGDPPLLTFGLLALEYAVVTPLLLRFVRAPAEPALP